MGSSKKIFSGVTWSIVMNMVNALYGFFMIPILISYFGKAEYGIIGLAQSVNAYMQIMDMGLNSTNVRFFSAWLAKGDYEKVKKLFSTCTTFYGIIGIINAVILVVLLVFSSSIFKLNSEQDLVLKSLLGILVITAFINWFTSCYNQIIQATENVAWIQKRLLVTKILMALVLVLTVVLKLDVITFFALTTISNWLILPVVVLKIKEVAPMVSFKIGFDKVIFKEILPYTLNVFSFTIFSFSFMNLRPIFLGIQSSPESVTDFKVIMGIYGIIMSISSVFLSTLLPSASKAIAQNDDKAFNLIAYNGTKFIMIFMGFCVFGMMSCSNELITLYVGEEYLYLLPWLNILLLTLLSNHILGISSLILGGTNIKPLSRMTAVTTIMSLIVAWTTIPKYDVGGAVIATITYTIFQLLFYYIYYWPKVMKIKSFHIFLKHVLPVVISSFIIYYFTVNLSFIDNLWLSILFKGTIFSVIYAFFVCLFINREDKEIILRMTNRKL